MVESLDSGRAAEIVEEMGPDAAADLLGDLSEDRTEEILVQMEPEGRQEVAELLEYGDLSRVLPFGAGALVVSKVSASAAPRLGY